MKRSSSQLLYPFQPRSTSRLAPGQFWAVPLSNDRFACGRVLRLIKRNGVLERRMFLCGLMDWEGTEHPTEQALEGSRVLALGRAHIVTIQETGGEILGSRPLEGDGIEVGLFQEGDWVTDGGDPIRRLTPKDHLPVLRTWGSNVIRVLAEKHFAARGSPAGPR